jgi:RHS repeat-associated protein
LVTFTTPVKTVTYNYDATGKKLDRIIKTGATVSEDRVYDDGIEYSGATASTLELVQTPEGRAIPSARTYNLQYELTDHLGNVRALITDVNKNGVLTADEILQKSDYYAFGREITPGLVPNPDNNYKYNKKEFQQDLAELDYGARFYDPVIARWNVIDPLSEKSRRFSPYDYVEDNPIRLIDPDGMEADDPKEKKTSSHTVSETFKYDDKSHKKGTDFITGSKATHTTTINKDGSTTSKVETVNRTATVDAKGKIGKDVTQTKSTFQETRTTNDKGCSQCLLPGSYSDNQAHPETSTVSYDQASREDPALKADVQGIANYKSEQGESPIQTIATTADKTGGGLGDISLALSLLLPEGALAKMFDAISWNSTLQPPIGPEGYTIEHNIDKHTKRVDTP